MERRDYKPYGERFEWTGPENGPRELLITFNGQRYDDATGLYYFGARHYDAEMGRFLTADTQVPDPKNPKTLNRYAFANGNPVRYCDPTGHDVWDWIGHIFIVIGLAIGTVLTCGALAPVSFAFAALASGFLGAFMFAGAFAFGAVALAQGGDLLGEGYMTALGTGALIGAIVGVGFAALPLSFGAGVGVAAAGLTALKVVSSMLVGAALGAIETTVTHFVTGKGADQLLGWSLLISVGIGFVAGFFGAGLGGYAAKAGLGLIVDIGGWFVTLAPMATSISLAATRGMDTNQTIWALVLLDITSFKSSPRKAVGVPAWAFADTWPGIAGSSGANEEAALLETMPLAP